MVRRKTALELINEFSINNNLTLMKKWSTRYAHQRSPLMSGYVSKLIKKIRDLLNLISGNDISDMIKSVLTNKEKDKIVSEKYKNVIRNMVGFYKKMKFRKRHYFVRPFKQAGFSFEDLKSFGFPLSKKLWRNCLNDSERSKGGGRPIGDDLIESIKYHLKMKSYPASNRTVKFVRSGVREIRPVRYPYDNQAEMFKSFRYNNELSKSTFNSYTKKERIYKKPFRFTDLCDYCEWAKMMMKRFGQSDDIEFKSQITGCFDVYKMIKFYQEKILLLKEKQHLNEEETIKINSYSNYLIQLKNYEIAIYHRMIADAQHAAYRSHKSSKEILKDHLLIEVDYKQKIVIGMSRRQINLEFYELKQRCCLGFGIYYLNNDDEIETINFDVITNDKDRQDMAAVVRGSRLLRSQQFFKDIDKDKYIVWTDCGKSFRNKEIMGYLMIELSRENIHVNLNFFGDKHGKNGRDSHFSCISKFLEEESLINRITSTKDVADAINKRAKMSNENRKALGKKEIKTIAYAFSNEEITQMINMNPVNIQFTFKQIESYFNYMTVGEKFEIHTSIISNNKLAIPIKNLNNVGSLKEADFSNLTLPAESMLENIENLTVGKLSSLFDKNLRAKIGLRMIHCFNKDVKSRNNITEIKINAIADIDKFLEYDYSDLIPDTNNNANKEITTNEIATNEIASDIVVPAAEKPHYCKEPSYSKSTKKLKPGCSNCQAVCLYTISELMNCNNKVGQTSTINELYRHGHPKSMNMNRDNPKDSVKRTTDEARQQLIEHYKYAHGKK